MLCSSADFLIKDYYPANNVIVRPFNQQLLIAVPQDFRILKHSESIFYIDYFTKIDQMRLLVPAKGAKG